MSTSKSDPRGQALGTTLDALDKRYGKGSVWRLGEQTTASVDVVSTGSLNLDKALGIGGYPRGRVVEIYGPESSGKTTLALHAIAEVQRLGGTAAIVDAEHALDVAYARQLGVDVDALLCAQPDYGEQALDITESLVRSGAVDLVVIDSVAALVPQAELNGDMGDIHVGLQARMMSQALRKITGIVHRSGTIVLFINQVRQKIGVTFGNGEVTTGGNALKFYATIRLDIRRIGAVKDKEENIGNKTKVKVVKNKLAPPFQVAEFDILFGVGVSQSAELLAMAEASGAVQRSGAWYSFGEERLGQGREAARERIQTDDALRARLMTQMFGEPAPAEAK